MFHNVSQRIVCHVIGLAKNLARPGPTKSSPAQMPNTAPANSSRPAVIWPCLIDAWADGITQCVTLTASSLVIIARIIASMLNLSAHLVCCRTSRSATGFKAIRVLHMCVSCVYMNWEFFGIVFWLPVIFYAKTCACIFAFCLGLIDRYFSVTRHSTVIDLIMFCSLNDLGAHVLTQLIYNGVFRFIFNA